MNFLGEDGRSGVFRLGTLPLPGWHEAAAAAFAARTGPAGTRRTLASARGGWQVLGHLLRSLAELDCPPATPAELTAIQLDAYMRRRVRETGPWQWDQLNELRALLRVPPLGDQLDGRVLDYLSQRVRKIYEIPAARRTGYSEGEFTRIVEAARADVASIRDRIDAGERLLAAWVHDRSAVPGADAELAAQLTAIAAAGLIPVVAGIGAPAQRRARIALAQRMFVTRADREALMVLLVAVTGRNSETLKELPAEHRILGDGAAVEVRIAKRRRGRQAWHDTVTWEIGPPHRELHTPGGLYLLLHRLMARSRAVSGSITIWSVWRNAFRGFGGPHEHADPFAAELAGSLSLNLWAAEHGLTTDSAGEGDEGDALPVRLPLIRTAVEVRRTRALGGHLPSAARSNTTNVLFANYLRGDATARAWAEDVIGEAVEDAEQAALAAHRSHLAETGHTSLHIDSTEKASLDAQHGAWTACTDPESHPATGRPCRSVSYLDCFHCGNCLITTGHLPAIMALTEELAERRTRLGEHDWWQRYGPVWAAIRRDILPKFTPAQLDCAATTKPGDALLELAEDPWEHP